MLKVSPVKSYVNPRYPTRDVIIEQPQLLSRHMPLSWQAKQVVAGSLITFALGSAGKTALADAAQIPATGQVAVNRGIFADATEEKQPQSTVTVKVAPVFIHGEGRGATGCVAVAPPAFLSEAEARQIIEDAFAGAGIVLDKKDLAIPDVTFDKKQVRWEKEKDGSYKEIVEVTGKTVLKMDGYCGKRNLGYEFVSAGDYFEMGAKPSSSTVQSYDVLATARALQAKLAKHGHVNAAVFYDPMSRIDYKYEQGARPDWQKMHLEAKAKAREQLTAQVNDFINWLSKQKLIAAGERGSGR